MARLTGFVFQDEYLSRLAKLSDQELGRLVRALAMYHITGEEQVLTGRESIAYDFIKVDIDRIDSNYTKKCERLRKNFTPNGEQKDTKWEPNGVSKAPNGHKDKDKVIDKDKDNSVVVNVAPEELPYGLTQEEVTAAISRDEQIEQAARDAGLTVSQATMENARRLADEHGMDKLLEAIKITPISAQRPSWKYVEGILERRGKDADSGHPGSDTGENKYTKLNLPGIIYV